MFRCKPPLKTWCISWLNLAIVYSPPIKLNEAGMKNRPVGFYSSQGDIFSTIQCVLLQGAYTANSNFFIFTHFFHLTNFTPVHKFNFHNLPTTIPLQIHVQHSSNYDYRGRVQTGGNYRTTHVSLWENAIKFCEVAQQTIGVNPGTGGILAEREHAVATAELRATKILAFLQLQEVTKQSFAIRRKPLLVTVFFLTAVTIAWVRYENEEWKRDKWRTERVCGLGEKTLEHQWYNCVKAAVWIRKRTGGHEQTMGMY